MSDVEDVELTEAQAIAKEKKTRGVRKSVLTKALNAIQRHMANEELQLVKDKLEDLKSVFAKFEEAHNVYHDLLKDDNEIDVSDNYFLAAETNYTDVVLKVRAWLKTTDEYVKPPDSKPSDGASFQPNIGHYINLPSVELEFFEGDPSTYHAFIAVFEECVEKVVADPSARLSRLIRFTKGQAKNAITPCSLLPAKEGYREARRILKKRFGDDNLIMGKMVDSIQNGKTVRSPTDLQELVDELNNCHNTLQRMGKIREVDSQCVIRRVVDRLQKHHQFKWRDHAVDIKKKTGSYPSFGDLVSFLSNESDKVNDPAYGSIGVSREKSKQSSDSRRHVSFNSGVKLSDQGNGKRYQCIMCKQDHKLFYCNDFKKLKPAERLRFVNEQKLCHICFLGNHVTDNCRRLWRCNVQNCGGKHSKFLHIDENYATHVNAGVNLENEVYLPVVEVNVGNRFCTGALLDSGSCGTFCTKTLIDILGIKGSLLNYHLSTLSVEENRSSTVVDLEVSSKDGSEKVKLANVIVVDKIPIKPRMYEPLQSYSHLQDIEFAKVDHVDLIIGQDHCELLVPLETKVGKSMEPFACRTKLGWTANGPSFPISPASKSVVSHFICKSSLEDKVEQLWSVENEGLVRDCPSWSVDDQKVIDFWKNEMQLVDGRWEIPIPWKDDAKLRNNIVVAKSRLSSVSHSLRKKGLLDGYDQEVDKLLSSGFAERVSLDEVNKSENVWYLPHHAVLNPKKPDKIRLVFDCSAKFEGESLNDKIRQGPDLNNRLVNVLLRFRQHSYAIQADIEAMYNQILIPVKERDALRFLWFDKDGKIVHYRMTRHLFGGIWCSCSSAFALQCSLDLSPDVDPLVRDTILQGFYVDDCLKSVCSKEDAVLVIEEVAEVLAKCGFKLTKFVSNDPEVLSCVPVEKQAKEVKELSVSSNSVLGIKWDFNLDVFLFHFNIIESEVLSRRAMLSRIASLFDPLGLMNPIVIAGKILFQDVTRSKVGWDEKVPPEIQRKWSSWISDLNMLSGFQIPRCLKEAAFDDGVYELHHFSDASERALGCCSYLRCLNASGEISSCLIISKAKVAPLKSLSIPRLELQAAVMSARMDDFLHRELELDFIDSWFWVDSELVLAYIRNETRRFNVFVANRVGTIRSLTNPEQWHHLSGDKNPADLITRSLRQHQLDQEKWFQGPEFLRSHKCDWVLNNNSPVLLSNEDPEVKNEEHVPAKVSLAISLESHPIDKLFQHYSSWSRLLRAVSWLCRFKQFLKNKNQVSPSPRLSVSEVHSAEKSVLKYVQKIHYANEVGCLQSGRCIAKSSSITPLSPILDDDGVMRVGGRVRKANLVEVCKHPVLVPHDHPIARMIVHDYHNIAHLGCEWVVSLVREKYWITKIRKVVKSVSHACVPCRKKFACPEVQKMADLPAERLCPGKPPFTYTGLDCFGPFKVKIGRSYVKRYGCVFTCLNTRAVHIEKLDSLSTDDFLNGLRRFISRRGVPDKIWSDNGTNFVGGLAEMRKEFKGVDQNRMHEYCLSRSIEWIFHPPSSSHWGGIWERMIRTIRKVMVGLPECRLSDDMLSTLFCEVEFIVNGRPITKLSNDVNDPSPLTPNHLLLLRECHTLHPGEFGPNDVYKRRWKCVQHLANLFWTRWLKVYVPELQKRCKWSNSKPNVKVNDLVLLVEENTPRGLWPLGVVVEAIQGDDGLVRAVRVKTKVTELTRPITKVVLLEGSE